MDSQLHNFGWNTLRLKIPRNILTQCVHQNVFCLSLRDHCYFFSVYIYGVQFLQLVQFSVGSCDCRKAMALTLMTFDLDLRMLMIWWDLETLLSMGFQHMLSKPAKQHKNMKLSKATVSERLSTECKAFLG